LSDRAFAAAVPKRPIPARDHCLAPGRVDSVEGGRYGRLFPELEPLECVDQELHKIGRTLAADPVAVDAHGEAGWPFFGQFVAHDITADRSPLTHRSDPERVLNFRSPRLNLEAVYGGGPTGSPYLFDREDPAKLLAGECDVPRNEQQIALLGDPRNDVHLFVNQLHVGFLRMHNRLVDRLREDGVPEGELFEEARRAAMWHYQWVVLHDFLPRVIDQALAAELLDGGSRYFDVSRGVFIPLEFADAAYRYGHSQVRQSYQVNGRLGPSPLFPDLMGFGAVGPDEAVDWPLFFDIDGEPPAQRAKRLDGRLPQSLIDLPYQIAGAAAGSDYASLAIRDLQRGQGMSLPSGEAVARHLGVRVLTDDEVGLREQGWQIETPLWLYVLREADVICDGDRLGPVGGRIVGEVILGLIDADPESMRSVDRLWRPTLPSRRPGEFQLVDALVPVGP
jgi:Animal haem peroxidase